MLELAAPAGEKEDMLGTTERSIVKFADWIVVSATDRITGMHQLCHGGMAHL